MLRPVLILSVLALSSGAIAACDSGGACIVGRTDVSGGVCTVNYIEEPCTILNGEFTRGSRSKSIEHCRAQGYVEVIGSGGPMAPADVDRALQAGEAVSYGKPLSPTAPR